MPKEIKAPKLKFRTLSDRLAHEAEMRRKPFISVEAIEKAAKILANEKIDMSARTLHKMYIPNYMMKRPENLIIDDVQEIKCPKCQDGTLELLSSGEVLRLRYDNKGDKLPDKIYGCDECKYWIDAKEVEC